MATTASPSPGYVGSERRPGSWPSEYPTHTIAALVLGLATFLAVPTYQYWRHWDAFERHYLWHYTLSGAKWLSEEARPYRLLVTVARRGKPHLTEDWEVMPGSVPRLAGAYDPGFVPFRLSAPARRRGAVRLEWQWLAEADNHKLNAFLRERIYHGETLGEMAERASWWGLAVLMVVLCVAIPRDARAAQERREGRVLRGPLVVTRDGFNRQRKRKGRTDGIGFVTTEPRSLREWLCMSCRYGPMVQIPREDEPRHHLLVARVAQTRFPGSAATVFACLRLAPRLQLG